MTNWKALRDSVKHDRKPCVSIGAEIPVELKTGETVVMVCEWEEQSRAVFFTKDLLQDTHVMDDGETTGWDNHPSTMSEYLEELFHLLPEDLQEVIRDSKLRLLREREVFGRNSYGRPENCEQFPRYQDQGNRVKRLNGIPFPYWLTNRKARDNDYFCYVGSDGEPSYYYGYYSYGVCFGFEI